MACSGCLLPLWRYFFSANPTNPPISFIFSLISVFAGYLLVMAPWFVRNISAFGTPLGPGGSKMLWLTTYDQLFSYPASQLTFTAWWQSGIAAILKARFWALGINLERTLAEQGEIFLLPLIGAGLWHLRKDRRMQLAGLAWLLTFAAMTVAFPFAGARGGFFHSGAALQPVWWALAPLGLDRAIEWGSRKRGWDAAQAGRFSGLRWWPGGVVDGSHCLGAGRWVTVDRPFDQAQDRSGARRILRIAR